MAIGDKRAARIERLKHTREREVASNSLRLWPRGDEPGLSRQDIEFIRKLIEDTDNLAVLDGKIDDEGYIVLTPADQWWPTYKTHLFFDRIAEDLLRTLPKSTLKKAKQSSADDMQESMGAYVRKHYSIRYNPLTKDYPVYASHWVFIKLKRLLTGKKK